MPHLPKPTNSKQRFKARRQPGKTVLIPAAVSISEPLYMDALAVAKKTAEGNFSRYVRDLIRADLQHHHLRETGTAA